MKNVIPIAGLGSKSGLIINDDCLGVMREMDSEFVDLVVTSPPYDKMRGYHGLASDFEAISIELARILKTGGVIVWVVGDQTKNVCESLTSFRQAIFFVEQAGLNLYDTMIFKKIQVLPLSHRRYEQEFEYMFVFSKGRPKTFNPLKVPCVNPGQKKTTAYKAASLDDKGSKVYGKAGKTFYNGLDKMRGNVWEYPVGYVNSSPDDIAFKHPAIFPENLVADHVLTWSNEGDTVFDPFLGSGTVLKVALLLDRIAIGVEISKEYCEVARSRCEAHQNLFGGVKANENLELFNP